MINKHVKTNPHGQNSIPSPNPRIPSRPPTAAPAINPKVSRTFFKDLLLPAAADTRMCGVVDSQTPSETSPKRDVSVSRGDDEEPDSLDSCSFEFRQGVLSSCVTLRSCVEDAEGVPVAARSPSAGVPSGSSSTPSRPDIAPFGED